MVRNIWGIHLRFADVLEKEILIAKLLFFMDLIIFRCNK